jgi:SOS-response transcriptional repressor LexA
MKEKKFASQAQEFEDLLKRTGWTVNELSRRTGFNVRTLANAASGSQKLGADRMLVVRNAASVPVYNAGSVAENGVPFGKPAARLRLIPVVSWASAGEAEPFDDLPSDYMDRIPSNSEDSKAFGVRLKGDSMEPRFSEGDTVILAPSQSARNGDLIVARIKKHDGVLFKRFHLQGDRVELTSYNPVYPKQQFHLSDFSWIYPVEGILKKP